MPEHKCGERFRLAGREWLRSRCVGILRVSSIERLFSLFGPPQEQPCGLDPPRKDVNGNFIARRNRESSRPIEA
jgi:hypothetical protein